MSSKKKQFRKFRDPEEFVSAGAEETQEEPVVAPQPVEPVSITEESNDNEATSSEVTASVIVETVVVETEIIKSNEPIDAAAENLEESAPEDTALEIKAEPQFVPPVPAKETIVKQESDVVLAIKPKLYKKLQIVLDKREDNLEALLDEWVSDYVKQRGKEKWFTEIEKEKKARRKQAKALEKQVALDKAKLEKARKEQEKREREQAEQERLAQEQAEQEKAQETVDEKTPEESEAVDGKNKKAKRMKSKKEEKGKKHDKKGKKNKKSKAVA